MYMYVYLVFSELCSKGKHVPAFHSHGKGTCGINMQPPTSNIQSHRCAQINLKSRTGNKPPTTNSLTSVQNCTSTHQRDDVYATCCGTNWLYFNLGVTNLESRIANQLITMSPRIGYVTWQHQDVQVSLRQTDFHAFLCVLILQHALYVSQLTVTYGT